MTLSRDERAAKIQQTKEERRIRRRASDEKRPWLLPVIIGVAIAVIVVGIIVSIAMGLAF
jgi:hypothetical protein